MVLLIATARRAHQCFADHVLWLDGRAKHLGWHRRDAALSFLIRASTRKRRRSAHALQRARCQPVPHAAHQQRDISSLATAIGMQLVQHEKAQGRGGE